MDTARLNLETTTPPPGLPARLEALLFAAPAALSLAQIAAALELETPEIEAGLADLGRLLAEAAAPRGLRLQVHHGRYQLTSAPECADDITRLLGLSAPNRLSRPALETLAIIAYQEPVTRPQIDAIRGVNSDGVLKSLLSKGLIQEVGRAETAGRPILYSTTADFLQHFGLSSLRELPALETEGSQPAG